MTGEQAVGDPLVAQREAAGRTWTVPALLRWLSGSAPLVPELSPAAGWRALAHRCDALRILPQAMLRLASEAGSIPAADVSEFSARQIQATVKAGRALHFGCRALVSLRDAGIAAAGFKGIAAVGWLHGGQPSRGLGDADILVPASQATKALNVLQAAGYRSKVASISVAEAIAFARNSPGSAGNESISLVTDEGFEVDLHWRLGAFDVDAAVAEASPVRVLGAAVPLVRPGVGLLLSAHHALRNDFVPDEVIRDMLDASGWFRLLSADPAEAAWADREARRIGLDAACGACAAVLADAGLQGGRGVPPPGAPARALAELFSGQVSHPMNTDLVYLCSLRPSLTLLSGLLRGGRGYLRAMRAVERAHGELQVPISARLTWLIADAWSLPWRRWRQLRALAAAKDRAGSSRPTPRHADRGA